MKEEFLLCGVIVVLVALLVVAMAPGDLRYLVDTRELHRNHAGASYIKGYR